MSQHPVAGAAAKDITPDWPVMLAGFGQRTTPNTGIRDRIHAKGLYLSNDCERLLVLTADILCVPRAVGAAVSDEIAARSGLAARQICVCASHTHSAPSPTDAGDGATGVADYVAFLKGALVEVGLAAIANARPARFRSGVGRCGFFYNRRKHGSPNLVDDRVAVFAIEDASTGSIASVLFGVGCHPVSLGWDNMEISGDFTGCAQSQIEARFPGAVALFFNTTEGNVVPASNPRFDALDPRGYIGSDYTRTAALGVELANEVTRVVEAAEARTSLSLGAERADIKVRPSFSDMPADEARHLMDRSVSTIHEFLGSDYEARTPLSHLWSAASKVVIDRNLSEAEMRRLMIACCLMRRVAPRLGKPEGQAPVDVPIQVIRINDFELLTLPGEVLVEVGMEWSRRAGTETAFIVGLANSHLMYLPWVSNFAEPDALVRYETVSAGLESNGIAVALDEGARMLAALRARARPVETRV
jgi:hypothetical protein